MGGKKYFVYHKKSCWSFKYIRKESDKSTNLFKERFGQYFDKKLFNILPILKE